MTAASVTAELWGKFLIALFECWVRADISRISIELLTPHYKNGVAAKTRNRAVAARRATGICCVRTLGRRRQTACFCAGYQAFYSYSAPHMRVMRDLIKQHRSPMELMTMLR